MARSSKNNAQVLTEIGAELNNICNEPNPSFERCKDLLNALEQEAGSSINITLLQETKIGVTLGKVIKALKRHKRTETNEAATWDPLIQQGQALVQQWKAEADKEGALQAKKQKEVVSSRVGLPKTVSEYRGRLVRHKKDLYKDPPVLPPAKTVIEKKTYAGPKRDKKTGLLSFPSSSNSDVNQLLKDFHPNRTPEEVLRAGSFGGTYFRPIVSAVTNIKYNASDVLMDTVDPSWIQGLDKKTMLTSATYRNNVNKYGVKCGATLGTWESSGWITDSDPYGWFQWYCRFYQGRRCSDDLRQISRWLKCAGPKGRFRSQLCNKILAAKTTADDTSISPVIRQTLLHWGLEITDDILAKHKKRVGG